MNPPLAFPGFSGGLTQAALLEGLLTKRLLDRQIPMVERKAWEQVVQTLQQDRNPFADPQYAVEIGRQVSARSLLLGEAAKDGVGRTRIQIRVVDVETSQLVFQDTQMINRTGVP